MPKIQGLCGDIELDRTLRWAALLLVGLSSGCVETFDGNGQPGEELRELSGFDRITSRGELEVSVSAGPFAVRVAIDQNLLERVRTRVDSGRLEIGLAGGNLGDRLPGPHVFVALPVLEDLELNGSGRVTALDFDEDDAVSVELAGAGELEWSGETPALDAVLNGSGTLTLAGSATRVDYLVAGSGTLEATELRARGATITVRGSGNVTATVDGRVDATVEGSGGIELFGDVTEGDWVVSEEGDLTAP
jgi:hypothetical protein